MEKQQMEETFLSELLMVIRAEGKWEMFGRGITSYPTWDDENQQRIHAGCLELERRGLIERRSDTGEFIEWRPKEGGG